MGGRIVLVQTGKDLRKINVVIGTGGVIINSKKPFEILKECIGKDRKILQPLAPKFKVDKKYILSAMGVLSMKNRKLAYEILLKNFSK